MNSRIQQRLRERMDALFLTIGGILIPLGFYLKVEQPRLDDVGTAAVLVGLVAWLAAYYFVKRKEKREQLKGIERGEQEQNQRKELRELLTDIRKELQKLNQSNDGQA